MVINSPIFAPSWWEWMTKIDTRCGLTNRYRLTIASNYFFYLFEILKNYQTGIHSTLATYFNLTQRIIKFETKYRSIGQIRKILQFQINFNLLVYSNYIAAYFPLCLSKCCITETLKSNELWAHFIWFFYNAELHSIADCITSPLMWHLLDLENILECDSHF